MDTDNPVHGGHGGEKTRYTKFERNIEQIIIIYEDGCVCSTINAVSSNDGNMHTQPEYRYGRKTDHASLLASGFVEAEDDSFL